MAATWSSIAVYTAASPGPGVAAGDELADGPVDAAGVPIGVGASVGAAVTVGAADGATIGVGLDPAPQAARTSAGMIARRTARRRARGFVSEVIAALWHPSVPGLVQLSGGSAGGNAHVPGRAGGTLGESACPSARTSPKWNRRRLPNRRLRSEGGRMDLRVLSRRSKEKCRAPG